MAYYQWQRDIRYLTTIGQPIMATIIVMQMKMEM